MYSVYSVVNFSLQPAPKQFTTEYTEYTENKTDDPIQIPQRGSLEDTL